MYLISAKNFLILRMINAHGQFESTPWERMGKVWERARRSFDSRIASAEASMWKNSKLSAVSDAVDGHARGVELDQAGAELPIGEQQGWYRGGAC
jgi:hypothetical protein